MFLGDLFDCFDPCFASLVLVMLYTRILCAWSRSPCHTSPKKLTVSISPMCFHMKYFFIVFFVDSTSNSNGLSKNICFVGTVPSRLHACTIAQCGQGLCAQKMAWPKCTRLMLLTVVWGTIQGDCVFAQTHTKLEGTLFVRSICLGNASIPQICNSPVFSGNAEYACVRRLFVMHKCLHTNGLIDLHFRIILRSHMLTRVLPIATNKKFLHTNKVERKW